MANLARVDHYDIKSLCSKVPLRGVSLIITTGGLLISGVGVADSKPPPIGGVIDSIHPLMEGS